MIPDESESIQGGSTYQEWQTNCDTACVQAQLRDSHNVGAVAVVQAVAPGAAVGQVAAAVVDLLEALLAGACTKSYHDMP